MSIISFGKLRGIHGQLHSQRVSTRLAAASLSWHSRKILAATNVKMISANGFPAPDPVSYIAHLSTPSKVNQVLQIYGRRISVRSDGTPASSNADGPDMVAASCAKASGAILRESNT